MIQRRRSPVCGRYALYVRLSRYWSLTDWRQSPAAEDLLPLNILGAFVWASLFTTLGYIGGEVIAPWLHSLRPSISSMASGWLLVIGIVAGVRWWMKQPKHA